LTIQPRAWFSWLLDGEFIAIIDEHGPRSVTNDVEGVLELVAIVANADLDAHRIVYRDSDGFWDGIITHGNRFHAFMLLRANTLDQAKQRHGWARPNTAR
jgi:hypothetical protein